MGYFFDTSALLKRYVREKGTPWVEAVVSDPDSVIYVAQITKVEVVSAIYRRLREGFLSPLGADDAMLLFRRHIKYQYNLVRFTNRVIIQAQHLSAQSPLRSLDAIQLASAIIVNQGIARGGLPPQTFVCADTRLLTVAATEGMTPLDPNTMT